MRRMAEELGFALPEVQSPLTARPSAHAIPKVMDRLKQQAESDEIERQNYMQQIAAERLRQQQMRAQEQAAGGSIGSTLGGMAGAALGSFLAPGVGTSIGGTLGSLAGNAIGRNVA